MFFFTLTYARECRQVENYLPVYLTNKSVELLMKFFVEFESEKVEYTYITTTSI